MGATQSLIAITGANGYIGQHVAKQLLDDGYAVRAIVRSQAAADRVIGVFRNHAHANRLSTALVLDNMRDEHVYDDAFRKATTVIHLAATLPEAKLVDDAAKSFLDPAVNGTLNAAKAAARQPSVRRFILASSIGAAFGGGVAPDKPFTTATYGSATYESAAKEKLDPLVYSASKQLSEQAFWAFVEQAKPSFIATALLPSMCVGPPVDPAAAPETATNQWPLRWVRAAEAFVDAPSRAAMAVLSSFNFVDVGDVARAFANAATAPMPNPKIDGQRLFVSERTVSFEDGAELALHSPAALTFHWSDAVRQQIQEVIKQHRSTKQPARLPQPFLDGAEALNIAPLMSPTESIRLTYAREAKRLEKELASSSGNRLAMSSL